jgi:hypothetical protein
MTNVTRANLAHQRSRVRWAASTALALATLLIGFRTRPAVAQLTRDDVIAAMQPYSGPTAAGASSSIVNRTTLTAKIMAGYQGWFTAEGDGANAGWRHYSKRGQFRPGSCNIDL